MTKFLPLFTFLALVFSLNGKAQLSQFSLSSGEVKQEATAIDRILEKAHRKEKIQIPNDLDEGKLVRRLYLSVAGRIPSYDETTAYLANESDRQKSMLIDSLLLSPAYQSQMFNWWADLLRLQSRMRGGNQIGAGELYNHWVKEQVAANKPFDQVAYSLVTAEGYPWEDGAAGYYLRDAGMELDNMSNTTQLFLGTQMVCAQGPPHPGDTWTQREYYKMAAFTYGISTRMEKGTRTHSKSLQQSPQKAFHLSKKKKAQSKDAAAMRKALREMIVLSSTEPNIQQASLPHDYQYDDAKPRTSSCPPKFWENFGKLDADSQVDSYGKWLTSTENPRFTRSSPTGCGKNFRPGTGRARG